MPTAQTRTLIRQIADKLLHLLDLLQALERDPDLQAPLLEARANLYQLWYRLHCTLPEAFTDLDEALDRLLAADPAWSHPAPVLGRPRPPLTALLAACDHRLATAQGEDHRRLSAVKEKLEKTLRVNERARRRALRYDPQRAAAAEKTAEPLRRPGGAPA